MIDLSWFQENAPLFSGELIFNEPLAKYTYYRIGGPAALLLVPKSREDLAWIQEGLRASRAPLFVLGMGSNILASDAGFPGVVVRAGRLNLEIEDEGGGVIRTGGSVSISTLLRRAAIEGWGGLEFLTGIPGSVGGAVVMNAGTHLGESASALLGVDWISLQTDAQDDGASARIFSGDELKYQYRKNLYLPGAGVVWSARWKIQMAAPAEVKRQIDETLVRRKSTQPLDRPSCGSVFKNPKESGKSAWQVIDQLGLRGHRIGDAQFAEKHSNFILNLGHARAADVRGLIDLAKARALAELGIRLEEEVMYVGSFSLCGNQ
ncbi:MAG: UDP-N-acetylmuramate dehydrogenase [Oligoflexia bacterium]|nr:UDP-N-acetylmuramate dehydrogenase [Oligoflexia bacterium]